MIVTLKNVHLATALQDSLSAACSENGVDWYVALDYVRGQVQGEAKDKAVRLIREMRGWPAEKWEKAGLMGRGDPARTADKNELLNDQGAVSPGC